MPPGLGYQDMSAWPEERTHFNKQSFRIRHFVYNPEGQNKIYGPRNAKMVRGTDTEVDTVCQIPAFSAPPCALHHLRLNIQCNDFAFRADKFGKRNGEIPQTTTYINDCLSWSRKLAQN